MDNTRNPGMLAIAAGVALAVLFGLLGVTGILSGQIGFGLAAACLVTSALLYIFYARGTAVDRTGYGALLMIVVVGLVLPVLTVFQQQAQANQTTQQYKTELLTGASIFGQYCATCHGYQGQGINGPQLNDNPAVNSMTDDDLRRIISAGIPGDPSNPTKLAMPAWLNTYGGSLTADDITYLMALIRSSDPAFQKKLAAQGLPTTNGFSLVYQTLINATQRADFKQQEKNGSAPQASDFKDETGQSKFTVQIVDTPGGVSNWGFSPEDIIVSPGTTVTWVNVSNFIHTVVTRPGSNPPDSFTSDILAAGNGDTSKAGTFSFTFTKPGDYPYYCSIHPAMRGWVRVK